MKVTRHPLFVPPDPPDRHGPPHPGDRAPEVPADAAMIRSLEASFALVSRDDLDLAGRVYDRLFAAFPGIRPLFPPDMTAQKRKLLDSLRMVIEHLRHPRTVRTRLLELGRAHVRYGARPDHYPAVTGAIVGAMGDVAGDAWSAEQEAEWTSALNMVASIMLEGAASAGR